MWKTDCSLIGNNHYFTTKFYKRLIIVLYNGMRIAIDRDKGENKMTIKEELKALHKTHKDTWS